MGIKNIHIVLIGASVILCLFFGVWSVNNAHAPWGIAALIGGLALSIYGVGFIKKVKTL